MTKKIADMMAETAREEEERRNAYAHVEYTGEHCPNCGRQRLERCANHKVICEKCHWEPEVGEYNGEHTEVHP